MNTYIRIKSNGHPDTLTDILSDVAINALHKYNEENNLNLYGDFSKSYLKGGKFPTFMVGGYLPFDFREYSKETRYDLFNFIKKDIVNEFKAIFPDPTINVKFDLNLEPSNIKYFIEEDINVDSTTYYILTQFTPIEQELLDLKNYIRTLSYAGADFTIELINEELVIEQTFFNADDEKVQEYFSDVRNFIDSLEHLSQLEVTINNDYHVSGNIKWSRFGSSVFHNGIGRVGNSNDYYGFRSIERPFIDVRYGKDAKHPIKYNTTGTNDFDEDEVGYIVNATVGEPLGTYTIIT